MTKCSKVAEQVLRWVHDQGVPRPGERVGVAVSGGADSVALLLLLLELREKLGSVLSVVHLNHTLRGRESDEDETFAGKLAAKHELPFHVEHIDVRASAKENKTNLEDAARRERYTFFARLIEAGHMDRVAVAHTADDQAETVLGHILRGTGLAGLAGIHPITEHVFRPLLSIRRAELRAYLRAKKQVWREDVTNRDTTKMRARIRRKLLPLIEKQFQPAVVEHLTNLAELARYDEAFLDRVVEHRYGALVQETDEQSTIAVASLLQPLDEYSCRADKQSTPEALRRCGTAISGRLVRMIVDQIKSVPAQLNAAHVRAVLNLAEWGQAGHELQLPGGLCVRREHDDLVFRASDNEKTKASAERPVEFEHNLDPGNAENIVRVAQLGCVFRFRVIDWPEKTGHTTPTGPALDRDALRAPLVLRNWHPGDKLHAVGRRGAHKLKRLLNQKRIGRWERSGWPVLTSGGVVAWARGFPVAAEFAANERTRAAMIIVEEPIS